MLRHVLERQGSIRTFFRDGRIGGHHFLVTSFLPSWAQHWWVPFLTLSIYCASTSVLLWTRFTPPAQPSSALLPSGTPSSPVALKQLPLLLQLAGGLGQHQWSLQLPPHWGAQACTLECLQQSQLDLVASHSRPCPPAGPGVSKLGLTGRSAGDQTHNTVCL